MPLVKVHNDNIHPYKEKFRDKDINIPAKGFITMEYDEALLFKGTFSPMVFDADGKDLPEGYKMIRVEEPAIINASAKPTELTCPACKYKPASNIDFLEHAKTHANEMVIDEEAEAEIKRKPGRPFKQAATAPQGA